jgi:hypothetical protein
MVALTVLLAVVGCSNKASTTSAPARPPDQKNRESEAAPKPKPPPP